MAMDRRSALAAVGVVSGLQLSGCAARSRSPSADRYCYQARAQSRSRPTCTPGPVPDSATDAQAKRFEAVPGGLVVYVVRHRWGDAVNVVNVGIDRGPRVATVPSSLVRLVIPPGTHRLAFDWRKGQGDIEIKGQGGQVLFVELIGSLWFWNEWYRLEMGEPSIQERALKSRLVADVKVGDDE